MVSEINIIYEVAVCSAFFQNRIFVYHKWNIFWLSDIFFFILQTEK